MPAPNDPIPSVGDPTNTRLVADPTATANGANSALSKLETGQRANPRVETLVHYAEAVGKRWFR